MSDVSQNNELSCLTETDVRQKILRLPQDIQRVWTKHNISIPSVAPGRDVPLMQEKEKTRRSGLTSREEQAKLLHNLANIELQAMELAFRSFVEYPDAPTEFREQMADLALSEAEHLALCLDQLQELGYAWGSWQVHLNLWAAVSHEDSLLDRLLIVHRYLEACGLDSGVALQKRLVQSEAPHVEKAVKRIAYEEIGHVAFGSYWYHEICHQQKLDSDHDFATRLQRLKYRLPRRIQGLEIEMRKAAGFTERELQAADELRREFIWK